jgi:hypothetical protein
MVWADEENKELCPLLHLQVYAYLIGIQGGNLFPTKDELNDPPADGVYQTWMSYDHFLYRFKELCETLFKREGPWGTHSCRKTGYLFAIWGGGTFETIMQSARHKDILSAKKYERDARYQLEASRLNGFAFSGSVSPWKTIYVQDLQLGRSISERGAAGYRSLYSVSKHFVEGLCGMGLESLNFSINVIVQAALDYQREQTTIEKLHGWLQSHAPTAPLSQFTTLIDDYAKAKVIAAISAPAEVETIGPPVHMHLQPEEPRDEVPVIADASTVDRTGPKGKRKRNAGENDLCGRLSIKTLKTGNNFCTSLYNRRSRKGYSDSCFG